MLFLNTLITTIIKVIILGAVAVGGVFFGKKLRARKNAKEQKQQ